MLCNHILFPMSHMPLRQVGHRVTPCWDLEATMHAAKKINSVNTLWVLCLGMRISQCATLGTPL